MRHRARASESELVELLDRMTDVSRSASAACAASDLQAIDTLLSARDVLLSSDPSPTPPSSRASPCWSAWTRS